RRGSARSPPPAPAPRTAARRSTPGAPPSSTTPASRCTRAASVPRSAAAAPACGPPAAPPAPAPGPAPAAADPAAPADAGPVRPAHAAARSRGGQGVRDREGAGLVRRGRGACLPAAALPDDLGDRTGHHHGRPPARLAGRGRRVRVDHRGAGRAAGRPGRQDRDRRPGQGGVGTWTNPDARRAGTVHLGGTFAEIAATERDIHAGRMPERPFVLVGQQYLADPGRSAGNVHPLWTYAHVPHGYAGDATGAIVAQIERFAPGFRDRIVGRAVRSTTQMAAYNPNYVGGDIVTGAKDIPQVVFGPRTTVSPYRVGVPGMYICSA